MSTRTTVADRARAARGGILIAGGGLAGSQLARGLGAATLVNPSLAGLWATCPGADLVAGSAVALDPDNRVVTVRSEGDRMTIAYAELVVAVGSDAGRLGLPVDDRGRIVVDETLQVVGTPHVWALGACAAVPNGGGHDVIGLARSLARRLRGDEGNRT